MSDILDLDLETLDVQEPAAPVAAKVKAEAKTVAGEDTGAAAPKLAQILAGGRAPKGPAKPARVLKQHDRLPRDVMQSQFTKLSGLEPRQAKAILTSVENFVEEKLKSYSLRFAGMVFKHASRNGRVNPNLQKPGEFSYTPAHLRVESVLPLMPSDAIKGRRIDDEQGNLIRFEAGAYVDGTFVPDVEKQKQIDEQQAVVDEFNNARRARSPMARSAAAASAKAEEAEVEDPLDVDTNDLSLED